jgi:TonB family protein
MLFETDKALELGSGRSKGLAMSLGVHALLFLLVLASPAFLSTATKRVIRIDGQDFDRERFDLTELVLPPELTPSQPEPEPELLPAPEVAVVAPLIPVPVPEAAPPPPPPPPEPEEETPPPEPESEVEPAPPPPVIGPDDVIEEGARPDAPPETTDGADESPRITLDEATDNPGDGPEGDNGDGIAEGDPQAALDAVDAVSAQPEETGIDADENTDPDALILPEFRQRANTIVEENLAQNRREIVTGRRFGDGGSGDELPDFSTDEPQILSDTRGYDFGPYMNQVVNRVRVNWYSLIPQAARLRQLKGRVVIIFTITKDGTVEDERIVADSGNLPLDRAAEGSILASNPFPRIPDDFDGDNLVLQFTFLYNMS